MKAATVFVFFSILAASAAEPPSDEEGKALLQKLCVKCHTLDATMRQRNTHERWSEIIDNMVSRGLEGTDADLEKVIDYLADVLGPRTNVNKANAADLTQSLVITREKAEAIVAYRAKNGEFKTLDDLKKVPGLEAAEIDAKKNRIDFTDPPPQSKKSTSGNSR